MRQPSVHRLLILSAVSLLVACTPARVSVNSTTDTPRAAAPAAAPAVPFDGSAAGEEDAEPTVSPLLQEPPPYYPPNPPVPPAPTKPAPVAPPAPVSRQMTLSAKQWEFSPSTITVNQGERVVLTITSSDVTHGFSLPEFNASAELVAGQATKVEFTADKAGTFTFSCSVFCGEGHSGMRGTLIVR